MCSLNCKADVDHDIWFVFLEKLWSSVIQVVIRRFQRFRWCDDLDIQPIVFGDRGQAGDNLPRWVDFDVLNALRPLTSQPLVRWKAQDTDPKARYKNCYFVFVPVRHSGRVRSQETHIKLLRDGLVENMWAQFVLSFEFRTESIDRGNVLKQWRNQLRGYEVKPYRGCKRPLLGLLRASEVVNILDFHDPMAFSSSPNIPIESIENACIQ